MPNPSNSDLVGEAQATKPWAQKLAEATVHDSGRYSSDPHVIVAVWALGLAQQLEQAEQLLDRVIDEGAEKWHSVVNDEPQLSSWLGLTSEEYAAWVEGKARRGG